MIEDRFVTVWRQLYSDQSVQNGLAYLRVSSDAPCDVFVGIHRPENRLALFIEIPAKLVSGKVVYPVCAGFTVEPELIAPGREGRVRIVLSSVSGTYDDVFKALCEDIVSRMLKATTEADALTVFLDRLHHWQAFFRKNLAGLGKEEQQGLYSELLTIRDILAPKFGITAAVSAWTGPEGANQDFVIGMSALEVKSTSANSQVKLRISNSRQLDPSGLEYLYLLFWLLDVRPSGGVTLPGLIDEIRELAASSAVARELLANRLVAAGYLDAHRSMYEAVTYFARECRTFHVREGFPRIAPEFLPSGIGDLRYSIEMTACLPFEEDMLTVLDTVGNNYGG
ncbi:PD-(D/E)XK motif protein [Bremerella cremea]|uniref:PD-(D/E)XK motif protein n=1 Tax=Bremerella cremea TaxID=1031537 RepID=UPI0031EFF422